MEKENSLIIWLLKGEMLRFEYVENIENNDTELKFEYFDVSTHKKRLAIFKQVNITGFALEVYSENYRRHPSI